MDLCSILAVYRQTYFSCLIDDATRYILHGEFYGTMEQGIVNTLQKSHAEIWASTETLF